MLATRDHDGRESRVELTKRPVWIGRAAECDVCSDHETVSRRHACVEFVAGDYWVVNHSSNGTWVNDQRVDRQKLRHNDVIRCGALFLRYIEEVEPMSATTFPPVTMEVPRPIDLAGAIVVTPSGPDASPPGHKPPK